MSVRLPLRRGQLPTRAVVGAIMLVITLAPSSVSAGPSHGIGQAMNNFQLFPSVHQLNLELEGGLAVGRSRSDELGPSRSGPHAFGSALLVYSSYLFDLGAGFGVQPLAAESTALLGRLTARLHVPIRLDNVVLVPSLGIEGALGRANVVGTVVGIGTSLRLGVLVSRISPYLRLGYQRYGWTVGDSSVRQRQFELSAGVTIRLAGRALITSRRERRRARERGGVLRRLGDVFDR